MLLKLSSAIKVDSFWFTSSLLELPPCVLLSSSLFRLWSHLLCFLFSLFFCNSAQVIRDVLLLGHRQAFAWVDEWIGKFIRDCTAHETWALFCVKKVTRRKIAVWYNPTPIQSIPHRKHYRTIQLTLSHSEIEQSNQFVKCNASIPTDMTMEEVREYERATQEATNLKIGTFPPTISISETPLPSSARSGPNSAPSTPLSTEAPEFLSVPKERPRKKSAPETLTLPDPGRRDSIFKLPSFFSWNSSPQPEWERGCADWWTPLDLWMSGGCLPPSTSHNSPPQLAEVKETFRCPADSSPFSRLAGVTAKPTAPRLPLQVQSGSPISTVKSPARCKGIVRPIESLSSWRLLILVSSSENRRPAPMRQTAWSPISQIEYSVQYIPENDLSHRASPYFHPSSGCVDEICWGLVTAHELVENLFIFLLYLWASESPALVTGPCGLTYLFVWWGLFWQILWWPLYQLSIMVLTVRCQVIVYSCIYCMNII